MPASQRQCASNGVVWLIIDASAVRRQVPADPKKAFASGKLTITDWIIDTYPSPQSVATLYRTKGMSQMQEMCVIAKDGMLAYTGAIASEAAVDGDQSKTTNYLLQAVNELLAAKMVSVPHFEPKLELALSAEPEVGQTAPDFTAMDISGKTVRLSDYRGKIVVLESHQGACPWCHLEYQSDAMQAVQRQFASERRAAWLIVNPGLDQCSCPPTPKRNGLDLK